jgi:hypothetical protein
LASNKSASSLGACPACRMRRQHFSQIIVRLASPIVLSPQSGQMNIDKSASSVGLPSMRAVFDRDLFREGRRRS